MKKLDFGWEMNLCQDFYVGFEIELPLEYIPSYQIN